MKVAIKLVSFLSILLVFACGTKGEKVEAKDAIAPASTTAPAASGEAATYAVNKGTLTWTGSKLAGTHTGTISVVGGEVKAVGENITGGQFQIDMGSIVNTDLPEDKQGDLVGHLKSPDFFDVAAHPTATFVLLGATPSTTADATHDITGNLTIKGITKSITFPANVAIVANKLTAVTPAFKIDRTQWGVEYGASSIVGIAKDKVISNDIALVLSLEASANAPVQ